MLFGAGNMGRRIVSILERNSINVAYIVDNNKQANNIQGLTGEVHTVGPESLLLDEDKNSIMIVITPLEPAYSQIETQLSSMGFSENICGAGKRLQMSEKIMFIDIVDSCNLKCRTCGMGLGHMPSTSGTMDIAMFHDIINKGKREGFSCVDLYNWTEPFLNANLGEYVKIAKQEGMKVRLSSNLSLKEIPHLEETLAAGVDILYVSVSGDTQDIYQINHLGGDLGTVTKHLHFISKLLKQNRIETHVILKFLKFSYNGHCEEPLSAFAKSIGIYFETIRGYGDPLAPKIIPYSPYGDGNSLPVQNNESVSYTEICKLLIQHVAINYEGALLLCCAQYDETIRIGKYLELDCEQALALRHMHPLCNYCDWKRVPIMQSEKDIISLFARKL